MEIKGIDVSSYQSKPDWAKVSNSEIKFAILRIHQKSGTDSSFEHNYKGCKSNGILVGGYKYSYALTPAQAIDEAESVISVLGGRGMDFPIFYDLEWSQNGVKKLVVQPTHLMHGAEYDELTETVNSYKDKFESVKIAEPLLGEVGADATAINEDKAAVAKAITAEAVKTAEYDSLDAAAEDSTAFVFMGHGTSHTAKISYSQMQTQMEQLGYENVFIGTVEGEPEDTACEAVIEKLKNAGYKKVILRPLMVVAGDHANNDMAGDDDDSWKSQFEASGAFDSIDTQIAGLGEIDAIQQLYVAHTQAAIDAE